MVLGRNARRSKQSNKTGLQKSSSTRAIMVVRLRPSLSTERAPRIYIRRGAALGLSDCHNVYDDFAFLEVVAARL
jgi:hypothetical protein